MYSSKIGDIATKIEKLQSACHKIESASGQMMDRSAALHFAATVVEIVDVAVRELVTDELLADKITSMIGDRIMVSLSNFKGPTDEN